MDRPIVYPGAIPLDTDLLNTNRNVMKAIGMFAEAVMGTGTVVSGLTVGPNSPAAMNVVVGPGSIFQLSTVDATAYGSLAADTADALVKQGINIASTTLAITAPGTSGQSQNYLIEAALLEADGTPVVLPYYNSSNPSSPYLGPGNAGTAQNTVRAQTVQLQAKAGVPATTGTQTTPAVDAGWVGLAVVTVAYGASSITSGNISVYSGAPVIPYTLPQLTFPASLVQNGYEKMPGGLIRQWGYGTITIAAATTWTKTSVTYPMAFPTACLNVRASQATSGVGTTVPLNSDGSTAINLEGFILNRTTALTGFDVWGFDSTETGKQDFQWEAIGY